MTIPALSGKIKFAVEGQSALPKWARSAISDALDRADSPPESLRFQCRIATDARKNLAEIKLKGGETLTLHPKAKPQFGKNRHGQPYLTATMIYSGDGEGYTLKWLGDAVPHEMQEVAVKHDRGLKVARSVIDLDLSAAQVTPSWQYHKNPKDRDHKKENAARADQHRKRAARTCARITDADLAIAV